MKSSEMWIFIWTANEDRNSSANHFTDFESAWAFFGDLKFNEFPCYIQRIEVCPPDEYRDPEATFFNWSQFIDLNVQREMAG